MNNYNTQNKNFRDVKQDRKRKNFLKSRPNIEECLRFIDYMRKYDILCTT